MAVLSFLAMIHMTQSMLLLFLLATILEGVRAASIVCGSGSIVFTVGVQQNVTCTNIVRTPSISPVLPKGLFIQDGVLQGTAVEGSPTTTYTIVSKWNSGTFTLGVIGTPTHISSGFVDQVVFSGLAIVPIRFLGNTVFASYSITPAIGSGLFFNTTTGVIAGTYTGNAVTVSYEVTGSNSFGSTTTAFTLTYKRTALPGDSLLAQSGANVEGLSACYYPQTNGYSLYPETWFYSAVADDCSLLESLDLADNFAKDKEHSWPGLSSRIEDTFSAYITGFLNIGKEANYVFILTALHSAALFFDEDPLPLVFIEGESSSARTDSDSIQLSPGRHLLRIAYLNNKSAARLKVEYQSDAAGLPRTVIGKTATFVGGRAPSFLEARDVTSFVDGVVKTERPRYTGSLLEGFSISPALPHGLALNERTGVISGSCDAEMDGQFTLTAAGPLGRCALPIRISIGGSPLPGLVAKYYSFPASEEMCTYKTFPSDVLTLKTETVDSDLYHPLLPKGAIWSGVPDDVFPSFFIVWSGFIHIPVPGDYQFFLKNRDGARILFDGEVFLESWRCPTMAQDLSRSRSVDAVGYYPFEVQFFSNSNDFVLQVEWKKPSDDERVPIDVSFFSHLPHTAFTYTTPKTHYYRSVPIADNLPVLFGIAPASVTFQILPALPNGLVLQPTGAIRGTPLEEVEETTYTVTATTAEGTVYTTTLSIEVSYVVPPSSLVLSSEAGQPVSSLTIRQFEEIQPVVLSAQNNPRSWRVEPPLPDGLVLDATTQKITGKAHMSQAAKTYSVIASNGGGATSATLTIAVSGCEYGFFFYTEAGGNSPTQLHMENARTNETVAEVGVIPAGKYGVALCIPNDEYRYRLVCLRPGQAVCVVRIFREDGLCFVNQVFRGGSEVVNTFSPEISAKPALKATDSVVLSLRQRFRVSVTVTGIYRSVVVESPIPPTVKYDKSQNALTGFFTEMGDYSVTLSAENDKGKGSTTVVFHVATCPEGKTLITFYRSSGAVGESMVVSSEAGEEVLEATFNANEYLQSACVANGDYRVTMKKRKGTWSPGTELLVKDAWDDVIASPIMDEASGEKTEYFAVNYVIMDRFAMKFYNQAKAPPSKWNTLGFNDKAWASADHAGFGNFTANTAYFRKEFSVDNRRKYVILAFDLEILDGAIAYINGKEVVRRNLARTGVDHASTAVSRYDALLWRRTTVPVSDLQNGKNVLAVELHRFAGADTGITFDMYGSLLSGECMKRTDKGRATDSEHTPSSEQAPGMAFDGDLNTSWKEGQLPLYLQFAYDYDRFEYINKVVLFAGSEYAGVMPKQFEILGMTGPEEGDVLASVDDRNLFPVPQSSAEISLHSSRAYNAYRLAVRESTGASFVQVAEMVLYTCNILYCPKERGWDAVSAGSSAYGSCRRNSFGEAHRTCSVDKYDAVWSAVDYSNCLSTKPPGNTAYIDFKYMVSNCTMEVFDRVVESRFIDITRDLLLAKRENIKLFLKRDCSDSDTVNVCFYVRVTTDLRIADYVFDNMNQLQEEMTYRMYTNPPPELPQGLYFVMVINPLLRTPGSMVVVVVVAVLVALIILCTVLMVFAIHSGKLEKRVGGGVTRKHTAESLQQMERARREKKHLLA